MENLCVVRICSFVTTLTIYLLLLRGDKLVGSFQLQCPNSEVI